MAVIILEQKKKDFVRKLKYPIKYQISFTHC